MELTTIKTFVTVAETGSINRAAHVLHRSQPAITRQLQQLEAKLGASLFDRRTKPATLTTAGKMALEQCRQILQAVAGLKAGMAENQEAVGELRIGISHSLAEVVLIEVTDCLRRLLPKVKLHITTAWSTDLLERVRAKELDFALLQMREGRELPAAITGRSIGTESVEIVASTRQRFPRKVDFSELAAASWILHPDGCGFRTYVRQRLQQISAPIRIAVEAHGCQAHLSLIARGVGLGLVPASALVKSRHRSKIRILRVRDHDFRVGIWAIRGRPLAEIAPALAVLEEEIAQMYA
jgi:DNA-binding transcriptional LysR family regulator